MNKIILGLDLGTNSIGWALILQSPNGNKILASGCRIIPMSQDELSNFDKGQSQSPTAERTRLRTMRRLRERKLLRRERLHRILNLCGFLPTHYAAQIDFINHPGKFLPGTDPKFTSIPGTTGKQGFYFMDSFLEMVQDFTQHQPELVANGKSIPFNWTIYFLRKKALTQKISKEELAWLLLHFNQKRGYNQLREEEEETSPKKLVEYKSLLVTKVIEEEKIKDERWYAIQLENGFIYKRKSKSPINWEGSYRDFIVTTDLNEDGTVKIDKYGKESRSLRSPSVDDWTLLKKKTEADLEQSKKTPGEYIYDALLQNPSQKIKGRLLNVIERKYYKEEIQLILEKQAIFHPEFSNNNLYNQCLEELYPHNINHRNHLQAKDLSYLFIQDILFYQRPLKSKKSLISNCRFEFRLFRKEGEMIREYLKCIPASHPLFQEFRLWNFIQRLRIFEKEKQENGKLVIDDDVTNQFLSTPEQKAALFNWLNEKKEIDEKSFLKYPGFKLGKNATRYRWNHLSEKKYPANETRAAIKSRLKLIIKEDAESFLTKERETSLWHILYSVENKTDLEKALNTFATKHNLDHSFVDQFRRFPPFGNDYGAYSQKSLNKLLPLLRTGKYWNENDIDSATRQRIDHLLNGVVDETISETIRKNTRHLLNIEDFNGLPEWLATSIVYNRHAETEQANKWEKPGDIQLVPQHSLRNPIVEKIVNETLRVVKDIWIEHGKSEPGFFQEIHVELGREMKNPNDKRKQITEQNRENENTHLRLKALLLELLNDGTFENVRPHSPMQLEILKLYEEGALGTNEVPEDISVISKLPQPSNQQLLKYKLWLQQRYRSPYTGAVIPLTRLFTRDYDIEHIIPRSRFFDDSFNNKVICERIINSNYKDNRLAYEFISQKGGTPVPELSNGKPVSILTLSEYEHFIKTNYAGNKSKLKRLLMAEIPETFIQRQLNDSRYISKLVKQLLSNIVREPDEVEATSKNLLLSNGSITSTLRQHWGLNDIWSQLVAHRFERMNSITSSNDYGQWVNKEGKRFFQTEVPLSKQKNFSKKRIDHRHHALDAIIVACTTRNHINYMNNEHAADKGNIRYELRQLLCEKKYNQPGSGDYSWTFKKPWESFTEEAKSSLQNIIPSFRQQVLILTRARNKHLAWRKDEHGNMKKVLVTQQSSQHWAIRKPLHQATVSGKVELTSIREIRLADAIPQLENIVDKKLRSFIKTLVAEGYDEKQLVQYFKKVKNVWNGQDISKIQVHFRDTDYAATRKEIGIDFNKSKIEKVTSPHIRNILLKHLSKFDEGSGNGLKENPERAFSPEGLEEMNNNIIELNGGKPHSPIYKVRLAETIGKKFPVGQSYNSRHKYVEAEKGTNLFFGIYLNEKGVRMYETIRLDAAIERRKHGLPPVPDRNADGHPLLFSLSPNDLIYMPDEDDFQNGKVLIPESLSSLDVRKIYKIVNFTGVTLLAIPCHVAKLISDGQEFTSGNKLQLALNGLSIREKCVKLIVDRLGQVKKLIQ